MPRYEQIGVFKNLMHKSFSKMTLGAHTNANPIEIKDDELTDSLNVIPVSEGRLRTRNGYSPNGNDLGSDPIDELIHFKTETVDKLMCVSGGDVYVKAYGDTSWGSAILTGLTAGPTDMIQAFNHVYIANGVDKVQKCDDLAGDDLTEDIVEELLATGDSTTTSFTGILAAAEIKAGTVSIYDVDEDETFSDNGAGVLTGSAGGSGTVNYSTGAYTVTFNSAPGTGKGIYADYTRYPAIYEHLFFWKNRIWGSIGSRLYYSAAGGDEFSVAAGGGFIDIYAQDGDNITGFAVLNDDIFVFKDRKIASVTIQVTATTSYMIPRTVREQIGSCASKSIVSTENNIFFLARDGKGGFQLCSLGPEPNMLEKVRVDNISDRVKNKFDEISAPNVHKACAAVANNGYWLCYPTSDHNDKCMFYDLRFLGLFPQSGFSASTLRVIKDTSDTEHLMFGASDDGQVHVFDAGYSDDGAWIESWILSKQYHVVEYITSKLWRYIDLYLQNVVGDLEITVYTDGLERDSMLYNVGGQVGAAGIGIDIMGAKVLGFSEGLQGTSEETIRMRVSRGYVGRTCQIKLSNTANNEHFDFLGMGLFFRHRNHRAFDQNLVFGGEL